MFTDYKLRVLENYQARRDAQLLPLNLIQPTPAKLKAECLIVCTERYNYKDKNILRSFFGEGTNKEDCLRAIKRSDVDKFRPLVNYLRQTTSETEAKNIEILAWLIDFENRPFGFTKNHNQEKLTTQDKEQKSVGTVDFLSFNIFLSYAWANTNIADEIDKDFKKVGVQFIRDVRDAQYRTSIKDFMHRVGKSDFVLTIISDEYLRSENCMYEVNELLNTHDFEQRILPIVTENALRIFKPINRLEYYSFWQEKKMEADKSKGNFPNRDTIDYAIKCQRIVDNLPDFFQKITDINVSTFEKLKEGNYRDLLKIIGVNYKLEHNDTPKNFNNDKGKENIPMGVAYIEHRPHATSEHVPTTHYVIVVNGIEVDGLFTTQSAAKNNACEKGYRPVHVARIRHLQDRSQPAHWRVDPC